MRFVLFVLLTCCYFLSYSKVYFSSHQSISFKHMAYVISVKILEKIYTQPVGWSILKYTRMQSVYLQKMKDMQMQLHFRFYVWRLITWKCNVHRNTNMKDEWTGLNLNSIWIFAIFPAASKMHSFVKIGFAILFSPQQG